MNSQRQDNRGQQQPMQANEVVSAGQKLNQVLQALNERGDELEGVLPKDLTLNAFLANVNQALRANPKLLRCTFDSIVNACVKAAYDGLRIDGKEAAIVDAKESYKAGNASREREVARYMPMVFGLIKQILQTGAAISVKAVIVYRRELTETSPVTAKPRFMLLEGTTPGIHHEPILDGDKGDMVGAYAIAEIRAGVFKFEWMDAAAIIDVKKEAKTDKVWSRWPTEMWKKTVLRRLRKSLSGVSQIRDMEAAEMFAQFDRTQPHPQLADVGTSARPVRALPNAQGTESGVPLDLGQRDDGVVIEAEREDRQTTREQPSDVSVKSPTAHKTAPDVELPEDERAWAAWGMDVEGRILAAKTPAAVDAEWAAAKPIFQHASQVLRDRLTSKVTERNADLALDDDGAGADGAD